MQLASGSRLCATASSDVRGDRLADQRPQRLFVDLLVFVEVDRTVHIAYDA
jgi:hypothetical protein